MPPERIHTHAQRVRVRVGAFGAGRADVRDGLVVGIVRYCLVSVGLETIRRGKFWILLLDVTRYLFCMS